MLYDGARVRTSHAKLALAAGDYALARGHILKAQAIVGELLSALDMSAGEIARNLFRIYEYVNYRLIEANLKHNIAALDAVLRILGELREGWSGMTAAAKPEAGRKLAVV
jgi:flagellar protein FliS